MRNAVLRRWLIAGAGLLAGLLLLWPLRLAPGLRATGLAAESVEGSVWAGQLRVARWHGIGLGDVRVGVSPLALIGGNMRLSIAGAALRGALLRGTISGVDGLSGDLALAGVLPLPLARMSFDGVAAEFGGGRCRTASGQVRLVPTGALASASGGAPLAGAIRCDGTQLLLPLAAGGARLDMRIGANGHYRAQVNIAGADPAAQPGLLAAGFQPTPEGVGATLEGDL